MHGRARSALGAGGVRTERGRHAIETMDLELRDARNSRNPGTTADLTAASIFVVLLTDEGWFGAEGEYPSRAGSGNVTSHAPVMPR